MLQPIGPGVGTNDAAARATMRGPNIGTGTGGQLCVSVGTLNSVPGSANVIVDVVGYLP